MLFEPEKILETTHRECLAVIWAAPLLRPYIKGTNFIIWTDQQALRWIRNRADATCKLARWHLRLTEIDIELIQRADVRHQAVDMWSGLSIAQTYDKDNDHEIPVFSIKKQSCKQKNILPCSCQDCDGTVLSFEPHPVKTAKSDDLDLIATSDFMLTQSKEAFCDQMKTLVGEPSCSFRFDENVLHVRQDLLYGSKQKLVPINFRPTILYMVCHSTFAGPPANVKCTTPQIMIITDQTWSLKLTIQLDPVRTVLE